MHSLHPELTRAMAAMLDELDSSLRLGGYTGAPVSMYLASGMAVHYHCRTRYTEDVDASFSARLLVSAKDLAVDYVREDGSPSTLYFDANYSDAFALLHPDHRENSVAWEGLNSETRTVQLRVFSPLDLAVSKTSRFSQQDHGDILALADRAFFTSSDLRAHAEEALEYYVGNTSSVRGTIDLICAEIG
jgi:hypothetical protein